MTVESRRQALLDLVEAARAQRCQALIGQARAQADAALAAARAQARAQLRATFAEERQRSAQRLAAARAELQTHRRLQAQRQTEDLLALAWQRLPAALAARWQDAGSRARWVQAALDSARAVLPRGSVWTIHHPADWPEAERAALIATLGATLSAPLTADTQDGERPPPQAVADARQTAGLRISAAGNVVDATIPGLLADRDEIGGRLIGLLEASETKDANTPSQAAGAEPSPRVPP